MTSDLEAQLEARECLDCLTPRQRDAVEYRAYGLTLAEIARVMGISAPAVYYLIRRAKVRMDENYKSIG